MAEEKPSHFDQAADALQRAMEATGPQEQGRLLDEALRLNREALADQRAKLERMNGDAAAPSKPK